MENSTQPIFPQVPKSTYQASQPYRVSPQERADKASDSRADTKRPRQCKVSRQHTDNKSENTISESMSLHVRELLYPGSSEDWEIPQKKWVYVFDLAAGGCVLEAYGGRPGSGEMERAKATYSLWLFRKGPIEPDSLKNSDPSDLKQQARFIDLSNYEGPMSSFGTFLSPFRLSKGALNDLISLSQECGAHDSPPFVRPVESEYQVTVDGEVLTNQGWVAYTPDPFRWAIEAHESYYRRLADEWIRWLQEDDRPAKLFIASGLEMLSNSGADIEGELKQSPRNWIQKKYEPAERKKREPAEAAAAYLVECISGPGHWAVEKSAMYWGDEPLAHAYQQWGFITNGINFTAPGRKFAQQVLREPRLPTEFVFTTDSPQNDLDFANQPGAFLGAKLLFFNLLPSVVQHNGKTFSKDQTTLKAELERLVSPFHETLSIRHISGVYSERKFNKIVQKQAGKVPGGIDQIKELQKENRLGYLAPDVIDKVDRFALPVEKLYNFTNFVTAIDQYRSDDRSGGDGKTTALISSSATIASDVADAAGLLLKKQSKEVAKGFGSAASAVSGACDVLDQGRGGAKALDKEDYDQLIGHSVAAVGGVMQTIYAASAIVGIISRGAMFAGPFGHVIGLIGTALSIIGGVLVQWFSDTPWQAFASRSFLGNDSDSESRFFSWLPNNMPTRSRAAEAENLLTMFAAFNVKRGNIYNPSTSGQPKPGDTRPNVAHVDIIPIAPAFIAAGSVWKVFILQKYEDHSSNEYEFWCQLEIHQTKDQILWTLSERTLILIDEFKTPQHGGPYKDLYHEIIRDKDHNITLIRLCLEPAMVIQNGEKLAFKEIRTHTTSANKVFGSWTGCILCEVEISVDMGDVEMPRYGAYLKVPIWDPHRSKDDGIEQASSFESDRYVMNPGSIKRLK